MRQYKIGFCHSLVTSVWPLQLLKLPKLSSSFTNNIVPNLHFPNIILFIISQPGLIMRSERLTRLALLSWRKESRKALYIYRGRRWWAKRRSSLSSRDYTVQICLCEVRKFGQLIKVNINWYKGTYWNILLNRKLGN